AGHALQEAHRPQVHVLLEAAPDRDQETPERDVVGNAGPADRAQIDRVELAELIDAVLGHELAHLQKTVAAPVEMLPVEREAVLLRRRLEHPLALGHDLLADAIAGDDGDFVRLHAEPSLTQARAYTDPHGRVEMPRAN